MAQARAAGAPTINYGVFTNTVFDFIILAFAAFLIVRQVDRIKKLHHTKEKEPETKECLYCLSGIPARATRCRYCTAELSQE